MRSASGFCGPLSLPVAANGYSSWQESHQLQTDGSGLLRLVLSPFPADSDAFGSPEHAWMLNPRVRDLDAMVAQPARS